ncbi:hypothetical protein D3C79_859320 [compost metagenome]
MLAVTTDGQRDEFGPGQWRRCKAIVLSQLARDCLTSQALHLNPDARAVRVSRADGPECLPYAPHGTLYLLADEPWN